jgi:hypothetical protein
LGGDRISFVLRWAVDAPPIFGGYIGAGGGIFVAGCGRAGCGRAGWTTGGDPPAIKFGTFVGKYVIFDSSFLDFLVPFRRAPSVPSWAALPVIEIVLTEPSAI